MSAAPLPEVPRVHVRVKFDTQLICFVDLGSLPAGVLDSDDTIFHTFRDKLDILFAETSGRTLTGSSAKPRYHVRVFTSKTQRVSHFSRDAFAAKLAAAAP